MSDIEIYRIKTRMLVYAIERGITDHIKPHFNLDSIKFEDLMFGEILQFFSKMNTQKNEDDIRSQLKNLADIIELATIRNACSHTVREFPIFYWYRAAAFAIDPRFQILGIKEPSESIACVESGQIENPPEEWLEKIRIPEITNNLPDEEQFDRTGLIGRTKEIDTVINDIKGGRNNTIALVGPGGVGKTSLAIEIARKLKDKYLIKSNLNSIIYLTLKKEYLTVDGIKKKSQEEIFDSIEKYFLKEFSEIYQIEGATFASIKEYIANDNLLVLIDNLEDLILEDKIAYEDFIEKLPSNWKVLITSRVSIDGAKNIPISALSQGAIKELGRKYYAVVSGKELDETALEKISNSCSGNPLALKLVIDRFNLGYSIEDSKSIAHTEILNFSFGALIDTLGIDEKKVLESIFICDSSSRYLISELTKLSTDTLVEVISKLQKTSLIERHQGESGEVYKISSAVRDLLASTPLSFELRTELANSFSKLRLKEQTSKTESLISINSFDPRTPKEFQSKYRHLPKLWAQHFRTGIRMDMPNTVRNQISELDTYLTNSETEFKKYSDYYRIRAYSRSLLHDLSGAISYAKKAFDIAPDSLPVTYTLAYLHLANKTEDSARELLKPFIEQFVDLINSRKPLDEIFHQYILRDAFGIFFRAATWTKKCNEVIDITKIWKSTPDYLKGTFVFSRANALRRMHEETRQDHPDRQRDLIEAARLLKYSLFDLEGSVKFLKPEMINIYKEMNYTVDRGCVCKDFEDEFINVFKDLSKILTMVEQDSNISHGFSDEKAPQVDTIEDKLTVSIYSIKPTYSYARDVEGNEYFIPLSSFNSRDTIKLRVGQKIRIWGFKQNDERDGARKANHASF